MNETPEVGLVGRGRVGLAARPPARKRALARPGALWLVVAAVLPLAAIGCGSNDHPAPVGTNPFFDAGPGAGGAHGGAGGATSRDASPDAPADASAGAGGRPSGHDGGDAAVVVVDAGCSVTAYETPPGDTGAAVCGSNATWAAPTTIAHASTVADDAFGSISHDETLLAWMSMAGGVPTLRYTERDSVDTPFHPAAFVGLADGYYAPERPALSPDGNRMIVVRADGKALGEYTRTGAYTSFSTTVGEASFKALNDQGQYFAADERFGDLMLSDDDLTLYYSRYDSRSRQTIYVTTRSPGAPWPVGTPVLGAPLEGSCGRRMRPTGISSDQLTLFYWDEVTGTERETFRSAVASPFVGVVDLGARAHATPNAACTRLYYSDIQVVTTDASGGEDVVVATR